jgi:hypothetical protein
MVLWWVGNEYLLSSVVLCCSSCWYIKKTLLVHKKEGSVLLYEAVVAGCGTKPLSGTSPDALYM